MSREKYSCYEFEVYAEWHGLDGHRWVYRIFNWNNYLNCEENIKSDEWFETDSKARLEVIEHIGRLENGDG